MQKNARSMKKGAAIEKKARKFRFRDEEDEEEVRATSPIVVPEEVSSDGESHHFIIFSLIILYDFYCLRI